MTDSPVNPVRIRTVLVEDHAELRDAFVFLVGQAEDLDCVGAFETGEEALAACPGLRPDVILMDIHLPGMSGVECVRGLVAGGVDAQIVMLTAFEDSENIFESMKAGATGYVLKRTPAPEVLEAIRSVHRGDVPMTGSVARKLVEYFSESADEPRGGFPRLRRTDASPRARAEPPDDDAALDRLTPREWEVLEGLAAGRLYKQIASDLSVSLNTVRKHVRGIYKKLHVSSRTKAARRFLER